MENMTGKRICVIGIWHLGSVYSACLADFGYSVVGVDKDIKKVEKLNKGIPPLFEPGQETLIKADRVTNIRKTNIENTNVL